MSKKGVPTPPKRPFSKPPTMMEAMLHPKDLDSYRKNMLDEVQQIKQHALEGKIHQQGSSSEAEVKRKTDFSLKQALGKENIACEMSESHFTSGSELKWLRNLLSLDALDPDVTHNNRNELIEKARNTQVKELALFPQQIMDDTKDQIAQPTRKINEAFFDAIISQLSAKETNTQQQAMIVHLNTAKNTVEPLAIAILKGENGTWVFDPKIQRSFVLNNNDMEGLKKLLQVLLEKEHQECTSGRIIQVFNKDKLANKNERSFESRAEPLAQLRDTQKSIEKTQKATQKDEQAPNIKQKEKTKPKPKPPTT